MSDTFEFPVERGHILQFARAIGEEDAPYVAEGVAPLTFTMAADHFDPAFTRRPRPGEPWPGTAGGAGLGFHAEEHFTYHRHPRAGDVLTVRTRQGDTWEKDGRRGGRLRFHESITEFVDADGELVVTARWVSCTTERVVT